jgi:hypothetical protein
MLFVVSSFWSETLVKLAVNNELGALVFCVVEVIQVVVVEEVFVQALEMVVDGTDSSM